MDTYIDLSKPIVDSESSEEFLKNNETVVNDPLSDGRDIYNTSIQKFYHGGRKKNVKDVLSGKNKIVNGMEDPSKFGFVFGVLPGFGGLFGWEENMNSSRLKVYDLFSDRSYSALTYLQKCHSEAKQFALNMNANAQKLLNEYEFSADTTNDNDVSEEQSAFASLKSDIDKKMSADEALFSGFNTQIFKEQHDEMSKFVHGFEEICNNHPYYFQSIDGLADAYKKYYNIHKDPMLGGGNDGKIKITCLESMDLRMTALFNSYFNSVYDRSFRRMRLPINLIRFDCYVLVHDMRNVPYDIVRESMNGNKKITKEITQNLSTVLFIFKNCWFNIEEIGSFLGTINNSDSEDTKFDFTFNYGDVLISVNSLADFLENPTEHPEYEAFYGTLDINTLNQERRTGKRMVIERDGAYDESMNLVGMLADVGKKLFNYASSGTAMGNVYDESWVGMLSNIMSSISNASASSILNNLYAKGKEHIVEKIHGAMRDYYETYNGNGDSIPQVDAGRIADNINTVYGDGVSPHSELSPENAYGEVNCHISLDGTENVYTDDTNPLPTPVPDNIYDNTVPDMNVNENIYTDNNTPLPTPVPDNIYDNTVPDMNVNENIYDVSVNGNTHDTIVGGETVYTNVTSGTEGLTEGNIYDGINLTHAPYVVEYAEMFTSAQHGEINVRENVYDSVDEHIHYTTSDNVYEGEDITPTQFRNGNVYANVTFTHSKFVQDRLNGKAPSPNSLPKENVYEYKRHESGQLKNENIYNTPSNPPSGPR